MSWRILEANLQNIRIDKGGLNNFAQHLNGNFHDVFIDDFLRFRGKHCMVFKDISQYEKNTRSNLKRLAAGAGQLRFLG